MSLLDQALSLFTSHHRNSWVSLLAGALFFSGWWVILDVAAHYSSTDFRGAFYVVGVVSTVALLMVNSVSNAAVSNDYFDDGRCGQSPARLWLLTGHILAFSALISSVWLYIAFYLANDQANYKYPGMAMVIHNALIFAGSFLFKFGRKTCDDDF